MKTSSSELFKRHKQLCDDIRKAIRDLLSKKKVTSINFQPYYNEYDLSRACIEVWYDKYNSGHCLIASEITVSEDSVTLSLEDDNSLDSYGETELDQVGDAVYLLGFLEELEEFFTLVEKKT